VSGGVSESGVDRGLLHKFSDWRIFCKTIGRRKIEEGGRKRYGISKREKKI